MSTTKPLRVSRSGTIGISVRQWGREDFNVSAATAYRYLNSADPPPLILTPTGRKLVAVNSPAYEEWLARHTIVSAGGGKPS